MVRQYSLEHLMDRTAAKEKALEAGMALVNALNAKVTATASEPLLDRL